MDGEFDPQEVEEVARRATAAVARTSLGAEAAGPHDPDRVLDRVLPSTFDWRGTVGRFPVASMLAAGAVGFVAGRARGDAVVAGVASGLRTVAHEMLSGSGPAGGSAQCDIES
jgi:hypothetical protein